jgi:hypothetical protein
MRRREFIAGLALPAVAGLGLAAEPARRLVLAGLVGSGEGYVGRWLYLVYTDAFAQLGMALEIRTLPAARAAAEAAAGHVDGELARSYDYGDLQPNLVRVPEPTFIASTVAYARRADIRLADGWEGLRDTPYRIEYRQGYPIMARKLQAVVPAAQLGGVRNAETGLRKLVLGRSDIYVDVADTVDSFLVTPEFRHAGIRQAALMEHSAMHAYLSVQHAELAPRLGAILKKMSDSGQTERYRQQAMKE